MFLLFCTSTDVHGECDLFTFFVAEMNYTVVQRWCTLYFEYTWQYFCISCFLELSCSGEFSLSMFATLGKIRIKVCQSINVLCPILGGDTMRIQFFDLTMLQTYRQGTSQEMGVGYMYRGILRLCWWQDWLTLLWNCIFFRNCILRQLMKFSVVLLSGFRIRHLSLEQTNLMCSISKRKQQEEGRVAP